jgi:3-methyladenine DNA glycosylase AlkD
LASHPNVAAEVDALRAELEKHRDSTYEAGLRRVVPSALPAHFVRVGDVRRIASSWYRQHRDIDAAELMDLADELWATGWREEPLLACFLLSRSKAALRTLSWSHIAAWSARIENWEHVDNLAMSVTGRMLALRPEFIDDVAALARRDHSWQRRLAIVTLIEATRRDARWRVHLATLADELSGDRGPTMQKAVAWARKVRRETEGAVVR